MDWSFFQKKLSSESIALAVLHIQCVYRARSSRRVLKAFLIWKALIQNRHPGQWRGSGGPNPHPWALMFGKKKPSIGSLENDGMKDHDFVHDRDSMNGVFSAGVSPVILNDSCKRTAGQQFRGGENFFESASPASQLVDISPANSMLSPQDSSVSVPSSIDRDKKPSVSLRKPVPKSVLPYLSPTTLKRTSVIIKNHASGDALQTSLRKISAERVSPKLGKFDVATGSRTATGRRMTFTTPLREEEELELKLMADKIQPNNVNNKVLAKEKFRIKYKWRVLIRKILFYNRIALGQQQELDNEKLHSNFLPHRPVDYFLVYSVELPASLLQKRADEILTLAEVEPLLAEFGAGTLGLKTRLADRFPRQDYDLNPYQEGWGAFAFPSGATLSATYQAPRHHYAVITLADGVQLFASFVTYFEPVQTLLRFQPTVSAANASRPATKSRLLNRRSCALFAPRVICLISHYPYFELMIANLYKWLSMEASLVSGAVAVEKYIVQFISELPLPVPGQCVVQYSSAPGKLNDLIFGLPAGKHPLCSTFSLDLLFSSLSIDTIIGILSAIVYESRIIFYSYSLCSMVTIIQSFMQLIYPFQWSSVYIPLLPTSMIDIHEAPQPFILGVDARDISLLTDMKDIILVDIDHNCIRSTTFLPRFPIQEGMNLWNDLKDLMEKRAAAHDFAFPDPLNQSTPPKASVWNAASPTLIPVGGDRYCQFLTSSMHMNPAVPLFDLHVYSALLKFFASLVSGYRRFLFFIDGIPFFNASSFLAGKIEKLNHSGKNVHENAFQVSKIFFDQFVESRLFSRLIEDFSSPYHDFLATESRQHIDQIFNDISAGVEVFTVPAPQSDSRSALDSRLSPRLNLPIAASVSIAQAMSNISNIYLASPTTPSNALVSPIGPIHGKSFFNLSHIYTASIGSSNRRASIFQPTPDQFRSVPFRSIFGMEQSNTSRNHSPRNHVASDAASAAHAQEFFAPFALCCRDEFTTKSPRDIRLPYSLVPITIVRRVKHLENTCGSASELQKILRLFMSRIFSSDKFEAHELDDVLGYLKDASVRCCLSSIIRSPFVHEHEDKSIGTKRESLAFNPANPPVSYSLSISGSPSLCLGTAAYEALAKILETLLTICAESKDYQNSVCAMDAATVFYKDLVVDSKAKHKINTREYIESRLKKHSFWKDIRYWKYLLDSEIARSHFSNSYAKSEFMLQFFIQCVHKMLSLLVDASIVSSFVDEEANFHSLEQGHRHTLKVFVLNMTQALSAEDI